MATDTVSNFAPHLSGNGNDSGDDEVICPTCDVKIKRSQVADHCQMEMERLHNPTSVSNPAVSPAPAAASTGQSGSGGRQPWSVFQRVQRNRQARQRQRSRKRPSSPAAPPPGAAAATVTPSVPASVPAAPPRAAAPETSQLANCPVCNGNFPQSSIQEHVNQCLRNSRKNGQANGERHSSEDSEDSEEYEEYEWAGQKRIRVSTLLQGGYSALDLGQTIKYNGSQQAQDDEDEDLNVDEDDTHIYGPTQYGEGDVIPVTNEDTDGNVSEAEVTSYVRRLISSSDGPKPNHSSEAIEAETATATSSAAKEQPACEEPSTSRSTRSASQNQQHVIESLKAKLRLYENQTPGKYKCLICLEDYKNPAISVSCWHVHCEQCWLKTLGARKLCPQCNSITTPKDLRRIYL